MTRPVLVAGLSMALLGGCDAPVSTPAAPVDLPTVEADVSLVKTRSFTFKAEDAGTAVVANCVVSGPETNERFNTPARIDLPIDKAGRALIDLVRCDYQGQSAAISDLPGPNTRFVKARYGGTGLFGEVSLLFSVRDGYVDYFASDGKIVSVRGVPDP